MSLLPLEGVWRLVTRARNRRHDRRVARTVVDLPVVSVGNVAVGGTGKTPVAAWMVSALREAGMRPGLLLRGYGEDEVHLHRTWNPEVPVEVDADRFLAAGAARDAGCDVAVLDDGFQHRGLGRVLDVVLLAAEGPVPGAVLPRGPYREPLSALRRADVVIVTRPDGSQREAGAREEAESRIEALRRKGWITDGTTTAGVRFERHAVVPLAEWPGRGGAAWDASSGVVVLAAIARPHAFHADVAEFTGAETELLAFPDHHSFTSEDVRASRERAGRRPIFLTEKDAVKLKGYAEGLEDAWVVCRRLVWEWGESDVRRRLEAVVTEIADTAGEEGP